MDRVESMNVDDLQIAEEYWEMAVDILKGRLPRDGIEALDKFINFHLDMYDNEED
jgi:anion-transporting  ArsA/GET3 family ATPase